MKSIPSISDFTEYLNKNLKNHAQNSANAGVKYGQMIASTVSSFSSLMSSSKGRDKICAFIQYLADFYLHCVKYSNIEDIQREYLAENLLSIRISDRIKESMSKGRKIFKFLKFLGQIKSIQKNFKKQKSLPYKTLLILINFMAFFYYLVDNILWGINIGILTEVVSKSTENRYKKYKNTFSIIKNILNILKNIVNFAMRKKKEDEILNSLNECPNKLITIYDESYDISRILLKERRKKRFEVLNIVISSLRIIMLIKSLKFPGYQILDPIFVSFCGLCSSFIKIIHTAYIKQKLLRLKKVPKEIEKDEDLRYDPFYLNRLNSEVKSSQIRKKTFDKKDKVKSEKRIAASVPNSDSDSDKEDNKQKNKFFRNPLDSKKK